jgi:tetratricopeptide (TPR) repeat protein
MINKNQLIDIIESTISEFRVLNDIFSPRVLEQKGSQNEWMTRDDVIHCSFYINQFADRLAWPRDHAKEDGNDYLKVNDEVWEKHQTESWQEALQMLENACRALIGALQPLSDEELNDDDTFTWMGEQSVAKYIPGLVFVHGMMHIQYAYMREGMSDAAVESADKTYKVIEQLDSSDVARGRNLYNKACSYTLAGRSADAIPMVVEAVKMAPNLLEWSKQDSDLDSLRDDPQFKTIYE